VSRLVAHGCRDLSGSIDLSSFGEYPISNGGFSDVYRGHLVDGTRVALKLLRISAHSLGQYPKHLKVNQACVGIGMDTSTSGLACCSGTLHVE
jgi:hypothetical protein